MSSVWLVARREVVERTREKSFAVGTAVTIAIVTVIVFLPDLFGGGTERVPVRVVGAEAERIAGAAARSDGAFDVELLVAPAGSAEAARAALREEQAAIALIGNRIVQRGGASDAAVAALQAASARMRQQEALEGTGVDPAVLDPPPLAVENLDTGAGDREAFAIVALILLYGQLITYGIWVATGVVEEKVSRIVEILLATIRPRELLAGKVLGIGLVGVGQLLFIGAVGLLIATASGRVDVGGEELSALPILLAWFVLGYGLYACAFAIVGALVSRQEDVQSSSTPLVLAMLASFFLSFQAATDPGSSLSQALSYIPFSAPLVVPVRMIAGEVEALEVVVSAAVVALTALAVVLFAGRLYGRAVLQTGRALKLREVI